MTKPRKTWSPSDPKHFEGKSLNTLQKELASAEKFTIEHPKFELGWHNEYVHTLKLHIAEKIGKK